MPRTRSIRKYSRKNRISRKRISKRSIKNKRSRKLNKKLTRKQRAGANNNQETVLKLNYLKDDYKLRQIFEKMENKYENFETDFNTLSKEIIDYIEQKKDIKIILQSKKNPLSMEYCYNIINMIYPTEEIKNEKKNENHYLEMKEYLFKKRPIGLKLKPEQCEIYPDYITLRKQKRKQEQEQWKNECCNIISKNVDELINELSKKRKTFLSAVQKYFIYTYNLDKKGVGFYSHRHAHNVTTDSYKSKNLNNLETTLNFRKSDISKLISKLEKLKKNCEDYQQNNIKSPNNESNRTESNINRTPTKDTCAQIEIQLSELNKRKRQICSASQPNNEVEIHNPICNDVNFNEVNASNLYTGRLPTIKIDDTLKEHFEEGDYIIVKSPGHVVDLFTNKLEKYNIKIDNENKLYFDENNKFDNLGELVAYYKDELNLKNCKDVKDFPEKESPEEESLPPLPPRTWMCQGINLMEIDAGNLDEKIEEMEGSAANKLKKEGQYLFRKRDGKYELVFLKKVIYTRELIKDPEDSNKLKLANSSSSFDNLQQLVKHYSNPQKFKLTTCINPNVSGNSNVPENYEKVIEFTNQRTKQNRNNRPHVVDKATTYN